jgi:hypothetical protein
MAGITSTWIPIDFFNTEARVLGLTFSSNSIESEICLVNLRDSTGAAVAVGPPKADSLLVIVDKAWRRRSAAFSLSSSRCRFRAEG